MDNPAASIAPLSNQEYKWGFDDRKGGIDRMTCDVLRQQIIQVLRGIYDPEIRSISMSLVSFTRSRLTRQGEDDTDSPNCSVAGSLPPEAESKVKAVAGVTEVRIDLVFDPPWSKDLMSEAAKLALGIEEVIPVARILHP